jgi:hypothetical protein
MASQGEETIETEEENDLEIVTDDNLNRITYAAIREANGNEPYYMRVNTEDYRRVAAAINQQIDARLQACFCPGRGDRQIGPEFWISPESLPVLIRRLFESNDQESEMLAQDMLQSLKFDERGQFCPHMD